jgi:3-hydroxyacyl-CoA dehydrogenase
VTERFVVIGAGTMGVGIAYVAAGAGYGDRFAPPPLIEEMVASGKLGKKSGEGFYRWESGVKQ